jgi:two-component system, cell cycle sensor histidine kinase and response regulator CckA
VDHTRGRILVVDDEEPMRELLTEFLTMIGYSSETANEGKTAVRLYETSVEKGAPFDAVILDLQMDGMGGVETMENLLKIDPMVKVVLCSGYFTDPAMVNYTAYGFSAALIKPFSLQTLSETLEGLFHQGTK